MTKDIKLKNDNTRFLARRKALGLTHQQVANYIGVSTATVSRWENGITCDLPFSKVVKYAEILQVSPLWILDPNEYKCASTEELSQKLCQSEFRHSKNFDADLRQFTKDYFDLVFADNSILEDPEVLKQGAIVTLMSIAQTLPIEKLLEIVSFGFYKFDQEYGTKTESEQVKKLAQLINKKK